MHFVTVVNKHRPQESTFFASKNEALSDEWQQIKVFLQPDTMWWRGICYGDVAVCVSVMLMYCAQTTESIIMRPSPYCSPTTLVFPYQIWNTAVDRWNRASHTSSSPLSRFSWSTRRENFWRCPRSKPTRPVSPTNSSCTTVETTYHHRRGAYTRPVAGPPRKTTKMAEFYFRSNQKPRFPIRD